MSMENFNLFPEAPELKIEESEKLEEFRELDKRLEGIFEAYKDKIVDGCISGSEYSHMQQEAQKQFPDVTASVFNPYLFQYKKIKIDTKYIKDRARQAARQSRLIKREVSSSTTTAISSRDLISGKNKAAGDDTPDLL